MKKRLRIFHVTHWYPNAENPLEALWIRRHIECLSPECDNFVLHLQVVPSGRWKWQCLRIDNGIQHVVQLPRSNWIVAEWVSALLLSYYALKFKINKRFDVINVHIAYPILSTWSVLRKFIKLPIVITEHWSAYHFNFNVEKTERLRRIKQIFYKEFPVIAVSNALVHDIRKFSGNDRLRAYVIPNIVDVEVFRFKRLSGYSHTTFFMVSLWKSPKDPIMVLRAFFDLISNKDFQNAQLRIGGYGPLWEDMKDEVQRLNLASAVVFLEKLSTTQIADEMNKAGAFIHCSAYETFSVVCAEALCCGTPVVASAVGGIKEFVTNQNGVLVDTHTIDAWTKSLKSAFSKKFDHEAISTHAARLFSAEKVRNKYVDVLRNGL